MNGMTRSTTPPADADRGASDRRSPLKRRAILDAATDCFLRDGYARTSVDAVAAAAGVGKQTVYSHFGDKEHLFLAAVDAARERAAVAGSGTVADGPQLDPAEPAAGLEILAGLVVDAVVDPTLAALRRLTISELPPHTELQERWRETSSPNPTYRVVVDYFAACAAAGSLAVPDAERTARQFAYLLATDARTTTAQGARPLAAAERRRIVDETVDLFLRASADRGRGPSGT